jgi:hypothetical protein
MLFVTTRPPALKIVLWYGIRRDQALVRLLLPGILAQLVSHESPTLHDLLCDFAREPGAAQLVLDAIEASSDTAPLVQSLATQCRRTLTGAPPE